MFTIYYNGMYINGNFSRNDCYVTDDTFYFIGVKFKSLQAAKIAITKARKEGIPESR
jgi:hypothetical protein